MAEPSPTPQKQPARGLVIAGLAVVAAAIAGGVFVYNGSTATAKECPVQAERAAAIDAAATGELAALNGTGEGRGYAALALQDASGAPTTLSQFAGKKLLVNFWASWCVPCREEMPELEELAAEYNSDAFMVLPINLDIGASGIDKARAFLAGYDWPNLPLYADPTFKAFDRLKAEAVTVGLPTTLVLDEKGCELAVLQGPARWASEDGRRVIEALVAL